MLKLPLLLLLVLSAACTLPAADAPRPWPHPIPVRVQDGANPDLLVATLGQPEVPMADGIFDPIRDEVRLNNGDVHSNYFKETLNVRYFKPMDKTRFPLPPSGWCSWYYYYQEIDENEVRHVTDWFAANLKDYGATLIQIDDGWQGVGRGAGDNRDWTTIDRRFSGGMDKLASYIKSRGFTAGIWLAPHGQSNEELVKTNANAFLLRPDGSSVVSTWEGRYLVDPSTPEARQYMRSLFSTLAGWGYDYFKIDGQPIVTREYRRHKDAMRNPPADPDALYRQTLLDMKEVIGPNRYLLGCWVVPLEGVGIMDGSRTSADVVQGWEGFRTAVRSIMQYHYLHNVAWYCDPDVAMVRAPLTIDQARAWASLVALSGQAMLVSDRVMDLSPDRVEILKRVFPATDIRPLDLFQHQRNKRIFDLKIKHLDRQYDVVGVFNHHETRTEPMFVGWHDLGLPTNAPVHVFDFWNQEYLGAWDNGIAMELAPTSCRILALLPATDRIELISTSRHITQGWLDLRELEFDSGRNSWSGRSRVVRNDPYSLRFAFPRGQNFAVKSARARSGLQRLPVRIFNHHGWAAVEITSSRNADVSWEITFEPAPQYRFPTREPNSLWAERVGADGVNLRWAPQHQPMFGHRVVLDGASIGGTPGMVFPLRNLDPTATYTAEVRTAWHDGTVSSNRAQVKFTLQDMLPPELHLSDLTPHRVTPGWRQAEFDENLNGGALDLGGKQYERGIGMPPNSEIEYQVKGPYQTFSAVVGVDSRYNREGNVEFIVLADGRELWRSGELKKSDGPKPVQLNVAGAKTLTLRTRGGTGGAGGDPANWADAKFLKSGESSP